MPRQYFNNAFSTLAANIGTSATTIEVQAGHGARFGTPSVADPVRITLEQGSTIEIVEATARTGDVLAVTRAVEVCRPDTTATAYAFTAGADVSVRNTAASYAGGGGGALGGGMIAGPPGAYVPLFAANGMSFATTAYALNAVIAHPILVSESFTLDRLGVWLVTPDATNADAVIRFGIWNYDATNHRPGTLVVDAGVESVFGGSARFIQRTISTPLTPGRYFVGMVQQGTANTAVVSVVGNDSIAHVVPVRQTVVAGAAMRNIAAVRYNAITGALGDITTDPSALSASTAVLWGRYA